MVDRVEDFVKNLILFRLAIFEWPLLRSAPMMNGDVAGLRLCNIDLLRRENLMAMR
jgi:hypothetical protein